MTYEVFEKHLAAHPSMGIQDAVKLCYQAAYGAEHLLEDPAKARRYFEAEYAAVEASDAPVFEPLSDAYCRCSLSAWKRLSLPREWLYAMFSYTAQQRGGDYARFAAYLDAVGAWADAGRLPFDGAAFRAYRSGYDGAPVRHSEAYRQAEHPAYRVVDARFAQLLPVLQAAAGHEKSGAFVMVLDGRAASGKTTAAALLSAACGASVVHMDDFFLPAELRTKARLGEAGGNVHYERFAAEVLPFLAGVDAFEYRCFDCAHMALGARRQVAAGSLRIVEGSYSCHPALGDYMDLRVFCHIEPAQQRLRILRRDGAMQAALFESLWIPMEEKYFAAYGIREAADIVLNG